MRRGGERRADPATGTALAPRQRESCLRLRKPAFSVGSCERGGSSRSQDLGWGLPARLAKTEHFWNLPAPRHERAHGTQGQAARGDLRSPASPPHPHMLPDMAAQKCAVTRVSWCPAAGRPPLGTKVCFVGRSLATPASATSVSTPTSSRHPGSLGRGTPVIWPFSL